MEKEYKISGLKIMIAIVLFLVIVAIICMFYPNSNKSQAVYSNTAYLDNINSMKTAGFEYFKGNNLPSEVGESSEISLNEMINNKLISDFTKDSGDTCNQSESYIRVTKTLDNEYAMKVALSCDSKDDYIVTTISDADTECVDCDKFITADAANKSGNKDDVIINNYYNESKSSDSITSNNTKSTNNSTTSNNTNNSTSTYNYNTNTSGSSKKTNSSSNTTGGVNQTTNVNVNINTCNTSNCNTTTNNNDCNESGNCLANIYYTVTFDSQNGSFVPVQIVKAGSTATYQSTVRNGYQFLGWYLNGVKYDFNTPVTHKIVLVAKWEKIVNNYVVSFDSNGGSVVGNQTVEEGNRVYRPTNPTKRCYDFVGWYVDSALTQSFDFATPITKNMTLYAKWRENDSCITKYIVSFNSNGGSSVNSQKVKDGDLAARPTDPVKRCYDFAGWYTDSSLTQRYDFGSRVHSNITLYAKWIENDSCISKYTVTFNTNGGNSIPSQTVKDGDLAARPTDPVRNCYDFAGWYTDSSLTQRYDFGNRVHSNITLYAKWTENDSCKAKYTVTFNTNGGNSIPSQTVKEGGYASRPTDPVRSCYDFAGWYTDSSLTQRYNFGDQVYRNITLYAKWVQNDSCLNNYVVSFNSNGGSSVRPQTVKEGGLAARPTDPVRSCYDFAGWYTNSSLTQRYDFGDQVYRNMTLYAKWVDNGSCVENYTVSFDSNGGSSVRSQTVEAGDTASVPSEPTRNGYQFLGWYYNNSRFNFNTRIYRDYTLVARWEREVIAYNTYCKNESQRFYSTSYVNGNQTTWNYKWTIKFDDLRNAKSLKIDRIGYLTSSSMYDASVSTRKTISMVNPNPSAEVPITSGAMLKTYSLKSNNFSKSLSSPYYSGGYWKTDASVHINNYNNVTKYYARNIGRYIYFVPFYFDVSYVDYDNCVNDRASNAYKYRNYIIVDTYYR